MYGALHMALADLVSQCGHFGLSLGNASRVSPPSSLVCLRDAALRQTRNARGCPEQPRDELNRFPDTILSDCISTLKP